MLSQEIDAGNLHSLQTQQNRIKQKPEAKYKDKEKLPPSNNRVSEIP